MAKPRNLRTCTVMVMTDGRRSLYHVMCGPMRGKSFNAARAIVVGCYEITSYADYAALTAIHATEQAPAVDWQRGA